MQVALVLGKNVVVARKLSIGAMHSSMRVVAVLELLHVRLEPVYQRIDGIDRIAERADLIFDLGVVHLVRAKRVARVRESGRAGGVR